MTQSGKLYGIGVGPGDPDLLTVKAAKVLGTVDVVFAAASTKNDYSTALGIARPHMRKDAVVRHLGFPMTKDKAELETAWEKNAEEVAEVLRNGNTAAFLTLGDSLTYSTYGYLLNTLKKLDPSLPCEAVPGITSYQAAAAKVGFILAESEESLVISSGVCSSQRLEELLRTADNAVIMKTYKNFGDIRHSLEKLRLSDKTVLVSRLGMEGESILHDIRDAPEKPHYFSLALVRKNPHD